MAETTAPPPQQSPQQPTLNLSLNLGPALERLLEVHRLNPTDQDCGHEIVRIARRYLQPAEWFTLLFMDLRFDLGFVWSKLHGQESIFTALTGWVAGNGTAGVIDGKNVQMIADNIPKHVGKVMDIAAPKMPWRWGKFTETEARLFQRRDRAAHIKESGAEWVVGEHVIPANRLYGPKKEERIPGIYYAPRVCDPPNPRDVLVMCRVPHPEGKTDLPDKPGSWGGSTSQQYFFMWGHVPFDSVPIQSALPLQDELPLRASSQYSVLRWCGYGFNSRKFYQGIVTGQSKIDAAIKMLDQLDLNPNKLPPGSKPKRRRANR